eukprot:TRINITY_DN11979_c1_g1_i1.p1 TRINITY_DN11979_c1_g1~~TRINITY_DN11979_c1_g1_i1.p1  ORF type:complete len:127 (+),score=27.13 TRINITY_DN11979_c1_g1_i1:274-654(+)
MATSMQMASAAYQVNNAASSAQSAAANTTGGGDAEDSGGEDAKHDTSEKKDTSSEWFDDLMEGFAEIYRLTVRGGQSCGQCVRSTSYPIKENMFKAYDAAASHISPTADQSIGRGRAQPTPVFAYE